MKPDFKIPIFTLIGRMSTDFPGSAAVVGSHAYKHSNPKLSEIAEFKACNSIRLVHDNANKFTSA